MRIVPNPVRLSFGPAVLALMVVAACSADTAGAVSFVVPQDGAVVTSPIQVEMAAVDFVIEPVQRSVTPGRGHFHIIVDAPCVAAGVTVGSDERHLHFGSGQSTATLELDPGTHTLCLQAADSAHTATDLVDVITITVVE